MDIDYHRTMFDLHSRVNAKEIIVGWYVSPNSLKNCILRVEEVLY